VVGSEKYLTIFADIVSKEPGAGRGNLRLYLRPHLHFPWCRLDTLSRHFLRLLIITLRNAKTERRIFADTFCRLGHVTKFAPLRL